MQGTRIAPQPGPQEQFLASKADIAIFGGAAGGGKTFGLLLCPLYDIAIPDYSAVIFRRTSPQITNEGGLWDTSRQLYPHLGATPIEGRTEWKFPDYNSSIRMTHLVKEDTVYDWHGAEVPFIGWDELTHFSRNQFFYMLSRNRTTLPVRPVMRATCNPDADSWVRELLDWWIDPDTGLPLAERSGVLRWFARVGGQVVWADSEAAIQERYGAQVMPLSLTFIPSKIEDNPILMELDPTYLPKLLALDPVTQGRLLHGNWNVKAEAGKVFNRNWFSLVDSAPSQGLEVFFWDFAATEKSIHKPDPDWTAGVAIRWVRGMFYVTYATRFRAAPAEGEELFFREVQQWRMRCQAAAVVPLLRWEIEPGSASRFNALHMVRRLATQGISDAYGVPSTGSKLVRAQGFASQAKAGNVRVVQGDWTTPYLDHLHNQPEIGHDDWMDGSSGAYNQLLIALESMGASPLGEQSPSVINEGDPVSSSFVTIG